MNTLIRKAAFAAAMAIAVSTHAAATAATTSTPIPISMYRFRRCLGASAAWYASLAELVMLPAVRDGFLASCHLSADRAHLVEAAIGDPTWATVERIDLFYWNLPLPMRLFEHPVMRSLRPTRMLYVLFTPRQHHPQFTNR